MSETSTAWVLYDPPPAGFGGWERGLPPLAVAQLRRAEQAERQREEREAADRLDRAETRREIWRHQRMLELSAAGRPFNPADDATLAEPIDEMCEKVFAAQDREARRAEFAAAREAGLIHLLNLTPDQMALEPQEAVQDRQADTALLQAHRATNRAKVRATASRALARIGVRA